MEIKLWGKIGMLRKQKKYFPESVGPVSGYQCQAVSKWENGTALPDVAASPPSSHISAFPPLPKAFRQTIITWSALPMKKWREISWKLN